MNNPTTVDVLESGLSALRERGFTKSRLEDRNGAVCALGALNRGVAAECGLDVPPIDDAGMRVIIVISENVSIDVWNSAAHALSKAVPAEWYGRVAAYNNAPGRTQAEVEDLFLRAIRDEKAKLAEPLPMPVSQPAAPASVDGTLITRDLAAA